NDRARRRIRAAHRTARALGLSDHPALAARQVAARLLSAVVDRKLAAAGLTVDEGGNSDLLDLPPQGRVRVRAIPSDTLRHRASIAMLIGRQLERPLPPNAHALRHILHVALAQILFLDVPARAAVDLAVEHAHRVPRTRRFARLANAVLRAILRLPHNALRDLLAAGESLPPWLAERLAAAYGAEKARAIAAAQLYPAPVDFTVKSDPAHWAGLFGGVVLPTGTVRVAGLR